jgi:hypothetical protein
MDLLYVIHPNRLQVVLSSLNRRMNKNSTSRTGCRPASGIHENTRVPQTSWPAKLRLPSHPAHGGTRSQAAAQIRIKTVI